MVHVSGEIALIALHPRKGTAKYRKHIAEEVEEVARHMRAWTVKDEK